MLTGRVAFARATATDTLAAVLEREPDWTALPADVPVTLRRLLDRCLQKDPRRRMRDMGDVRSGSKRSSRHLCRASHHRSPPRAQSSPSGVGSRACRPCRCDRSACADVDSGVRATSARHRRPHVSLPPRHVARPSGIESPNAVARRTALRVRANNWTEQSTTVDPITRFRPEPVVAGNRGRYQTDLVAGRSLGRVLRRWKAQEGQPVRRAAPDDCVGGRVPGRRLGRARRHHLRASNRKALLRVHESGGSPTKLTKLDRSLTENSHRGPFFLPDGRRFLFTNRCEQRDHNALFIGSIDSARTASDAASIERRLCSPA